MKENDFQISLGRKIASLRKQKGYTQVEFAKVLKLHKQNFNKLELGKTNPTVATLNKIVYFLDIPLKTLFD
jgi:transcriptional regulator with XRE-family HTH domain